VSQSRSQTLKNLLLFLRIRQRMHSGG